MIEVHTCRGQASHSRNENCITARQVHSQMQKVHGTYCALAAEHVQKRQSVEPSQRGCQNDDLKVRHVDTRPVGHQNTRCDANGHEFVHGGSISTSEAWAAVVATAELKRARRCVIERWIERRGDCVMHASVSKFFGVCNPPC